MSQGVRLFVEIDDKGSPKLSKFEKNFRRMQRRIQGSAARIRSAYTGMQRSLGTMTQGLQRMAMIGRLALAGLAIATVVTAAKFEQSMANVAAISSASEETLNALSLTARRWGETTAFTASEAADAMVSLAQAGLNAAQIQETVGDTLLFAGAAQVSLKESAEATVQALKIFNLEAEESTRVVNVFAAGMTTSLLTADRLKEALSAVGATAHASGLDLEETVGILGALHNAGILGASAGTKMKNVLVRLQAPNAIMSELMGGLNLQTNSLAEIMDKLGREVTDVGKIYKAFGRIAGPAALSLMAAGRKELEAQEKAVRGTNKVMEMYETQMNTLSSRFKIFKSAIQENMIAAFTAVGTDASGGMDKLTQAVRDFKPILVGAVVFVKQWVQANGEAIKRAAKLAGKILLLTIGLSAVFKIMGLVNALFMFAVNIWKLASGVMGILTVVVRGAITAVWQLGAAIVGAVGAGPLIIAALVAGLVALGVWLFKTNDTFREFILSIMDNARAGGKWIKDKLSAPFEFIKKLAGKVAAVFDKVFPGARELLAGLFDDVKEKTGEALDFIGDKGGEMASSAKEWDGQAAGFVKTDLFDKVLGDAADAAAKLKALGLKSGGGAVSPPKITAAPEFAIVFGPLAGTTVKQLDEMHRSAQAAIRKRNLETLEAERSATIAHASEIALIRTADTTEWLTAQKFLLASQLADELDGVAEGSRAAFEIKAAFAEEWLELQLTHEDAILEKHLDTQFARMAAMQAMGAASDAFFASVLDKELTGKKRREKIWLAMKKSFIRSVADMAKAYLKHMVESIILASRAHSDAAKKSRIIDAKAGAVRAYSAFAGIPIIGPILGAAAAVAAFAFLMAFHKGGFTPGGREFPVLVEGGEHITRRSSVTPETAPALAFINRTGRLPDSGGTGELNVEFNIGGGGGALDDEELVEELEETIVPLIEDMVSRRRSRIAVNAHTVRR